MDSLAIRAARHTYTVRFEEGALARYRPERREHVVVDRTVADRLTGGESAIRVRAGEELKSLAGVEYLCEQLLARGARRGDTLVAVGGGSVGDVVAFVAETFARGLAWRFFPTTLLAQADSCVGGKSSLNVARTKNVLGTITPPVDVTVDTALLATLPEEALRSGLGEILKAHALAGPQAWNEFAARVPALIADRGQLAPYVRASLDVKRRFVEEDEGDTGVRRLLNFGHTFGHALESALELGVPHGVAVAWGMQIANRLALELQLLRQSHVERMQPTLFALAGTVPIVDPEWILRGLRADKKRKSDRLTFILLCGDDARAEEKELKDDLAFADLIGAVIVAPWLP